MYGYYLFIFIGIGCFVVLSKQFSSAAPLIAVASAAISAVVTVIYSLAQLRI